MYIVYTWMFGGNINPNDWNPKQKSLVVTRIDSSIKNIGMAHGPETNNHYHDTLSLG